MAKLFIENTTLTNIANAIRNRTGKTEAIRVSDMAFEIENINDGTEPVLQEKSIAPNESIQMVTPDENYDGLSSVSVEAVPSTYIGSEITRVEGTTIVPSTNSQIAVQAGSYVTGNIEVAAIENLDAEISEQDSLIEQIQTALEGKVAPSGGVDTSDATATESDIASGKTAYVKGVKITGTHTCSTSGGEMNLGFCTLYITNNNSSIEPRIEATVFNGSTLECYKTDTIPAGESLTVQNVLQSTFFNISAGVFMDFNNALIIIDGIREYPTTESVHYSPVGAVTELNIVFN